MARRRPAALAAFLLAFVVAQPVLAATETSEADLRAAFAALIEKGDHTELLRAADTALAGAPENVAAMEHRAYALQKLGRGRQAASAYAAVLKLRPDHAWALTQLGWIEIEMGHFGESVRHLRRAVVLQPDSLDAQRKLVTALRAAGDFVAAHAQVVATRDSGSDAAWTWREQAELEWMRGDLDAATASLGEARKAGADDVTRLAELVAFDRELLKSAADPDTFRRQREAGTSWQFEVGDVVVRTAVGPRLPAAVERMLRELPERFADLVGGPRGPGRSALVLLLSRTTEQHEVLRRRQFPRGSRGRAFTGMVRGARSKGSDGEVVIRVAWTAPDLATSIAHEMGHAALLRAGLSVPLWLDEGIATYLEKLRTGEDDPATWRDDFRVELTRALRHDRILSWERMLAAQRSDFEGAHGRERYAQAWSMVRFLLHADEMGADAAIRRERLRSIVAPARSGGAFRVAGGRALIEATYGLSLGKIDAAWRRHIGAPKRDGDR